MYFLGGIAPHDGFFIFPTFFDGFRKKSKNLKKNTKIVLSISSRIVKIRVGGWYHSIQHWMYFLGGKAPPPTLGFFPTFCDGFWEKSKILKKNTKIVLSIFPRVVKVRVGGWYHSIQHWIYFLGGIAPPLGFFPDFFWRFLRKNLKFWKKYKNCFVDFSTYGKDTGGGLVPFDSALNVLPRGYSSPRWVFYFPDFFWWFLKKI